MTRKTGKEIERDIFELLRDSYIVTGQVGVPGIGGAMYRGGQRARDARTEDLVVIFTTATSTQFQEGVVTLNIYVPDIVTEGSGFASEDVRRCEELERLAQDSVDALTADVSDYLFFIERSRVIHTLRDEELHQSFVVVPLAFKYIGE